MAQPELRDEARASRATDEALESTVIVGAAPEASEVRPSVRLRSFEPGEVVAERYRLDRKIGEGGMGVVWAATHTVSQRKVALKFLKSENEDRARRLLREARISGHLSHPNIVEVLDAFSAKGATVLVMELLDGETVEAHLARKGVLTEAEAITLLTPVLDALSSAHRAGIVHRDLKPANIFLAGPEARVKVLDFGIAKMGRGEDLSASASLTQTGSLVGTPHYMAPEQVFGDPDVDARADVWALGVILFECVSGQRPFEAESFGQIIKQVTMGSPRPLPASVSPELRALVERMLARDRGDRPRDAAEVRQALAFPAPTEAARTVPPPAAGEATHRPRWGAAGIVVAMLAAGGLGVWAMAGTGTSRWHAPGERNDGRALRTATTTPAATVNEIPPARGLPPLSTRAPGRPVASTSPTNTAELPGNVQRHSPY